MIEKRTVFDIQENKYDLIYKELFNIALEKYAKALGFNSIDELKSKYVVIENRKDDSLNAPSVILKSKTTPIKFIRSIKDKGIERKFEYYWPSYKFENNTLNIINIYDGYNFGVDELVDIDYVRGIGRIHNKYTDITYDIPIYSIPDNIKISDNLKLTNTFLNLLSKK